MTSNSPELGRDKLPGGPEGPSVVAVAGEALIDLVPAGREGLFEAVPGGSPECDFRVQGTADWQWRDAELTGVLDDQVVALHDGSLAFTMPPGADALGRLFERAGGTATVADDPDCRPLLMGAPQTVRDRIEGWSRWPTSSRSAPRTSHGCCPVDRRSMLPRGGSPRARRLWRSPSDLAA
jgi:hypothetical protein